VPQEPANGYVYGNCTYYVSQRFPQINQRMGNAIDWIASAKRLGYPILSKPTPGTIVVYGSGYSQYGHVAVVDSVNGDGTFNVSEMNYNGFNVIDKRKSTTWNVLGFIVPPGTTLSALSSQQNAATGAQKWVYGPVSVLGSDIYFDGVVGWAAMIGGAFVMLAGLTVLVAFALKNTGLGNKASSALALVPNPVAQVAARAASSQQAKVSKDAQTAQSTKQSADSAHTERMAKAKSRLSPEAEGAVSEARAGRGKRLSSNVRGELSA
jgi:hypothetical protein